MKLIEADRDTLLKPLKTVTGIVEELRDEEGDYYIQIQSTQVNIFMVSLVTISDSLFYKI